MAGVKISQLQDGGALQNTDAFPVARGSFTRKILGAQLLTPTNFNVADSPTIDLDWNSTTRTLSADVSTAVKNASAFNVVDSPTIDLNWNSSTRTLSAGLVGFLNKTSNYSAINGDKIAANTSEGSFTITLPASPTFGTNVTVVDAQGTWDTNNLTIARNGSTIEGLAENLTCDVEGDMTLTLLYNGTTWKVYA